MKPYSKEIVLCCLLLSALSAQAGWWTDLQMHDVKRHSQIQLRTNADNKRAQGLYKKLGFVREQQADSQHYWYTLYGIALTNIS